jgi:hypothetical protein
MFTLNILNNLVEKFVSDHKIIETWRFEDVGDINNISYPLLYGVIQPCPVNESEEQNVIRFYISDKTRSNAKNKIQVLSDTKLLALDVLSYFNNLENTSSDPSINSLKIKKQTTLNDFIDTDDDEVSGWWFDVTFSNIFEWNKCVIPLN